MNNKRKLIVAGAICLAIGAAQSGFAWTFTTIDHPSAEDTFFAAIDDGRIVGSYTRPASVIFMGSYMTVAFSPPSARRCL